MRTLRERTVDGIEADRGRARELLDRSTAVATALSPYIGYAATAEIAKASVASGRPIRDLVLERGLLPAAELDRILSAEAMTSPGIVGAGRPAVPRRSKASAQPREQDARHGPGEPGDEPARRGNCRIAGRSDTDRRRAAAARQSARRTGGCFRRRTSGCSRRPIATSGSGPIRSWTRSRIAEASVVADVGAGGGWFTVRLARRVGPNGIVYAEDVQAELLTAISRRVAAEGLRNVKTDAAAIGSDPRLPARSLHAVLMVDAYTRSRIA